MGNMDKVQSGGVSGQLVRLSDKQSQVTPLYSRPLKAVQKCTSLLINHFKLFTLNSAMHTGMVENKIG